MERRFEGKVVLITGAAGGIGRAMAQRFAAEGARLALVDLPDAALEETVAAVEHAGSEALPVPASSNAGRATVADKQWLRREDGR